MPPRFAIVLSVPTGTQPCQVIPENDLTAMGLLDQEMAALWNLFNQPRASARAQHTLPRATRTRVDHRAHTQHAWSGVAHLKSWFRSLQCKVAGMAEAELDVLVMKLCARATADTPLHF